MTDCTQCSGAGEITTSRVDGSGGFIRIVSDTVTCSACNGTGSVTPPPVKAARTRPSNGYERAARERKAWHLYDAAQRLHVGASDLADAEIRQAVLTCARLDGAMKDPSEATWAIVTEHLITESKGGRHESSHPQRSRPRV